MKSEKGSALLIVILIVFVTATIGSALTAFIMMNYKLRDLDNRIGQAEYQGEKMIDVAYLATQNAVKATIEEAWAYANSTVVREPEQDDTTYRIDIIGKFKELYEENLGENIESEINDRLGDLLGFGTSDRNDLQSSTSDAFAIELNEEVNDDKMTETIKIYYKTPNSPIVEFSADFIISLPDIDEIEEGKYNLNEIVGITNYKMTDRGYL